MSSDALTTARPATWPLGLDGLAYGGDYNPEQWDDATRLEDVTLMRQAGVNLVSLAIFSWAWIEPREGEFEWEWLDTTMDRLHEAGIGASLATATASPPPWLSRKHPEILPQRADGTVLWPGGRQHYRISSPIYRQYAVAMARRIAERYADHPALSLWHIDNEIGCHIPHDYSDDAAIAFRRWLSERYGTIAALNEAWGTAFWSQRYDSFEEILPPRVAPTYPNPTQQLDFARYSSDELLGYYQDLRDALAEATPQVPCTTNFMVCTGSGPMDYNQWAPHMDVVTNDHYVISQDPHPERELAFSADSVRSMAGGGPWILMEHSTSAVNWHGNNRSRATAESHRHSLSHVAHGSDGLLFFQWRQSKAGAEKFHSGMYPHAGDDSDIWRGTVRLGEILRSISEVRGSRVQADAAVIYDYPSTWAARLDSHPSEAIDPRTEAVRYHHALNRRGITSDVVAMSADLSAYRLIIVPEVYLVTDEAAANLARAAEAGATVLVTYFSGIVDENDHVRLGGYPGAFRELLGLRVEEWWALQPGETVRLDDGLTGSVWSEKVLPEHGTKVLRSFTGGALDRSPALTRRSVGAGNAWYLATRLDEAGVQDVVDALIATSEVAPVLPGVPDGVELTRRVAEDGRSWVFAINHTDTIVRLDIPGTNLISASTSNKGHTVCPGEVAVIREEHADTPAATTV